MQQRLAARIAGLQLCGMRLNHYTTDTFCPRLFIESNEVQCTVEMPQGRENRKKLENTKLTELTNYMNKRRFWKIWNHC